MWGIVAITTGAIGVGGIYLLFASLVGNVLKTRAAEDLSLGDLDLPPLCTSCHFYLSDPPSTRCPSCEAHSSDLIGGF